jgi:hypothetical protein
MREICRRLKKTGKIADITINQEVSGNLNTGCLWLSGGCMCQEPDMQTELHHHGESAMKEYQ